MIFTDQQLIRCVECLANETRMRLLKELASTKTPLTPTFLAARVHIRQSIASHHLVLMANEGMVVRIPSGGNVLYLANPVKIREILNTIAGQVLPKETQDGEAKGFEVPAPKDTAMGQAGLWEDSPGTDPGGQGPGAGL
jgi:DNA-binding transcriptional ArsR family regulator